jgi:hypothetical protein
MGRARSEGAREVRAQVVRLSRVPRETWVYGSRNRVRLLTTTTDKQVVVEPHSSRLSPAQNPARCSDIDKSKQRGLSVEVTNHYDALLLQKDDEVYEDERITKMLSLKGKM